MDCSCGFFHPAWSPDYSSEPAGGNSALAFYLQQGAGLWGITSNIADLGRPPGTRYLEIGCGFGFGLDFARRALRWEVLGLDPSPFAVAGRELLALPIESRYLVINDPALAGQFDVVMASEVIEHVSSPPAFTRTLLTALRPGGTLVLTTPDVAAAMPDTPHGLLVPLLSIGFHLVLQSASSLSAMLVDAGFEDVEVSQVGGASLLARCRRPGGTRNALVPASNLDRNQYRRYLDDTAAHVQEDGDLWFGLVARAYREAVNAGDAQAADVAWTAFSAACGRRFGFEPEASLSRSSRTDILSLDDLVRREPLCLGPVLLHRAMHRLLIGASRSSVEALFEQAVEGCQRLRTVLQRIGTDDGDAEDVAWTAQAEALLCAAERGATGVAAKLHSLGPAPADAARSGTQRNTRADGYRRRAFVSLVNASQFAEAGALAAVVAEVESKASSADSEQDVVLADDELDVLYCAAARELQIAEGSAECALKILRLLRAACIAARNMGRSTGSALALVAPAREAEILALRVLGRNDEAEALRKADELTGASERGAP
jgi:SAM-dependent methyltransferase